MFRTAKDVALLGWMGIGLVASGICVGDWKDEGAGVQGYDQVAEEEIGTFDLEERSRNDGMEREEGRERGVSLQGSTPPPARQGEFWSSVSRLKLFLRRHVQG